MSGGGGVDWRPLVEQYLAPHQGSFQPSDVDRAEEWASNATAFSATGSWRARIRNGELWVKMIRVHSHWAERASVLRIILLALQRAGPRPLDLDFVYAHSDNDPTPVMKSRRRCKQGKSSPQDRSCSRGPMRPRRSLVLFTNSHNPRAGGIPVPEFTWVGWGEHGEPWCRQAKELDAAAAKTPWGLRDPRLFFSGGLDNGHHRKELRKLSLVERAAGRAGELHIRDVGSRFHRWGQFDKQQPKNMHALVNGTPATAIHESIGRMMVKPVPATAACAHQFSINVPGFGYSSRLRSLLQCGNTVIHVNHPSSEFFMPLLLDGTHFFVIGGREPVRDRLLPLLRAVRANDTLARSVAVAGQEFAKRWLNSDAVVGYMHTLLLQYGAMYARSADSSATLSRPKSPEADGYVRVKTEADLPLSTGMCTHCARPGKQRHVAALCAKEAHADEVRMMREAGTNKPRPSCTLWPPKGGGRCLDLRCCVGWDCGTQSLRCTSLHSPLP